MRMGEKEKALGERAGELILGTIIAVLVSIPAALYGAYLGLRLAIYIAQKYF